MTATTSPATDSLNIRIRPEDRLLFDRAARAQGVNRTQFVIQAARREAEHTVLNQTVFQFDAEAYARFMARLDAPGEASPELRRTLTQAPPWQ